MPKAFPGEVMDLCYDIPSTGHQGIQHSKERLKPNFYGVDGRQHVISSHVMSVVKKGVYC